MDSVADALDWVHETFSDPALSKELRADLGITGNPQGALPTGDKVRMRHPNGDAVDVDKAAFDATVAEVRAAFGTLVDFFRSANLSVAEIWDVLTLLGQIGAAESIRVRFPATNEGLRAAGFIGGLTSREDVAALNILRAVDLIGGKSNVPTDTTDPDLWEGVRNWVRYFSAILIQAEALELPIQTSAAYGFEPDMPTTSPVADVEARGAFALRLRDTDPGQPGFDGNFDVTWLYFPPKGATPYRLFFAFGGGASFTKGRFTASVDVPAAFAVMFTRPFTWEDVTSAKRLIATAAYGRADAKALVFGEADGPHVIVESVALKLDLGPRPSARLEAREADLSLALADADSFLSSLSQELKTTFDIALIYDKDGLRFEGGPKRGQGERPKTLVRAGAAPPTTGGTLEAEVPQKGTSFGPFRLQKGHIELGCGPDGEATLELSTAAGISLGPFDLVIDRIGLEAGLRAGGVEPNLGLVHYGFGFKLPDGIGVTLDAKLIKGGGFLSSTPTGASTPACSSSASRASRSKPSASSTRARPGPGGRSCSSCPPSSAARRGRSGSGST